jgi:CheY-like chemotaxis protein
MSVRGTAEGTATVVENSATGAGRTRRLAAAKATGGAAGEFLADISHDVRSPLTAILGFADVLLENVHDPACIDAAIAIKRNSCHLLNLINNIADLSKLEAGELAIEKARCSPINSVADIASVMRIRAQLKRISLQTEFVGPIPETIVTDPLRLRQILINLVGNAVRFTESGSVRLSTRLCREEGQPPRLQFDVIDTGIGICREHAATLFEPVAAADDGSVERRFRGPRLGLSVTKRLVELLGGTISVESEPGRGTAIHVTIDPGPLEAVSMVAEPSEAVIHRHDAPTVAKNGSPRIAGRVLLVEDGRDNQRLIAYILRKAGAEVAIAENGQEAIDQILAGEAALIPERPCRVAPFDVVLMDMQMPILDGYSATRRLRSMGYAGPIIALTAHAMSQDRQKCLEAGCDEYLSKPVEQRRLLDTVAEFQLRAHRRPRSDSPLPV